MKVNEHDQSYYLALRYSIAKYKQMDMANYSTSLYAMPMPGKTKQLKLFIPSPLFSKVDSSHSAPTET